MITIMIKFLVTQMFEILHFMIEVDHLLRRNQKFACSWLLFISGVFYYYNMKLTDNFAIFLLILHRSKASNILGFLGRNRSLTILKNYNILGREISGLFRRRPKSFYTASTVKNITAKKITRRN